LKVRVSPIEAYLVESDTEGMYVCLPNAVEDGVSDYTLFMPYNSALEADMRPSEELLKLVEQHRKRNL